MKAIQFSEYGPAEVLQLVDIAAPETGPGQVRIDVHAVSVNPVDWKIRAGLMAKYFALELPAGTGRDGAGIVSEIGDGAEAVQIGDAVSFMMPRGVYCTAEQIAIPAEFTALKPGHISMHEAAAYPLAAVTAWAMLEERYAGEIAGRDVLVHGGAGGVGGMLVQIARHMGARVAATCSAANTDYVTSLGAATTVAYDAQDFTAELSDMDVVFDTMGGEIHARSYAVLKKGGHLVCINAAPIEDLSAEQDVTMQIAEVSDIGGALAAVAGLIGDKVLAPQVNRVFPLDGIADAHRLVETGHARSKIVVTIGNP